MTIVEVKTAELIGYALDWAVGVACKDSEPRLYPDIRGFWLLGPFGKPWNPSEDWSQGGPLIEKLGITLLPPRYPGDKWGATYDTQSCMFDGGTALIAACRAIVAAKLGDTVQVPEELIK